MSNKVLLTKKAGLHSASSTNYSVTSDRLLHLLGFCVCHRIKNSTDTKRLFWEIINACNIFKSRPGKRKSTLNFSFYNFYLKILCLFSPPWKIFYLLFFFFSFKIPFCSLLLVSPSRISVRVLEFLTLLSFTCHFLSWF